MEIAQFLVEKGGSIYAKDTKVIICLFICGEFCFYYFIFTIGFTEMGKTKHLLSVGINTTGVGKLEGRDMFKKN